MKAVTKFLAGGAVAAAVLSAAPAAAQYYPNPYGYGYGSGGSVVGQVLNQVLGGGNLGYGANQQVIVNQCVNAVQARLANNYGYNPYGGYNNGYGYGYQGYAQPRVLGISRVEPRSGGGLTVRGVANSGRMTNYGYGYNQGYNNGQPPVDLTFRCRTDYRGYVVDVDIDRASSNYGYNYTPWNNDYSQYGYRRY